MNWNACCWIDGQIRAQSRIQSESSRVVVRLGLWCELSVSDCEREDPV
jgi:hypothetical protein